MGDSELTDGVWAWPQGLSHYVGSHDVVLPDEVLAHFRHNDFRIPADVVVPPVITGESIYDTDFWIEWGKTAANKAVVGTSLRAAPHR